VKFRILGPVHRRTKIEYCACGLAYTTYWAHRETAQHKAAMRRWRKAEREQRKVA